MMTNFLHRRHLRDNSVRRILSATLFICIAGTFITGCINKKSAEELIVGKWNLVRYEYPHEKGNQHLDSIGKIIEPLAVEFFKDHTLTSYREQAETTHGTYKIIHVDGNDFLESADDTSNVQNEIIELNDESFKLDIAGVTTMVFERVTD